MAKKKMMEEPNLDIESSVLTDVSEVSQKPTVPYQSTLYNVYRRGWFDSDPIKNLEIYNKMRRGYEGKERSVILTFYP